MSFNSLTFALDHEIMDDVEGEKVPLLVVLGIQHAGNHVHHVALLNK